MSEWGKGREGGGCRFVLCVVFPIGILLHCCLPPPSPPFSTPALVVLLACCWGRRCQTPDPDIVVVVTLCLFGHVGAYLPGFIGFLRGTRSVPWACLVPYPTTPPTLSHTGFNLQQQVPARCIPAKTEPTASVPSVNTSPPTSCSLSALQLDAAVLLFLLAYISEQGEQSAWLHHGAVLRGTQHSLFSLGLTCCV